MIYRETEMPESVRNILTSRLADFYASTNEYTAFQSPSNQVHCWRLIGDEIVERVRSGQSSIRVLEVGAGRSGFSDWLVREGLREDVVLSAQDVVRQNEKWLVEKFDSVIFGEVGVVNDADSYDIIFSTYVFEHVSAPSLHLEALYGCLRSAGSLYVFCPRYEVFGYMPPSTRHLSAIERVRLMLKVVAYRSAAALKGRPSFLVQTDLSIFHRPFFTDADACHWAAMADLRYWSKYRGAIFDKVQLKSASGLKNWIVFKFLTCAARIRKPVGPS